ncbi:MAG: hypothetical protein M0D55_16865 [Elusimicrobiota bacterium]|nr:MAG: hypothetical protein M0D55_16865 [Elusimicrobiota bacterium]
MSEQNKSNLQALGAGLVGFAAVVAIGGGALFVHSKLLGGASASRPAPAAAPIDLGSSMPRPSAPLSERREQSPAPLVGGGESIEAAAPAEARAGSADAAQSARAASAAPARADGRPALKASEHLTAEASTSAEARVGEKPKDAEKAPAKLAKKPAAAAPSGDGASGATRRSPR